MHKMYYYVGHDLKAYKELTKMNLKLCRHLGIHWSYIEDPHPSNNGQTKDFCYIGVAGDLELPGEFDSLLNDNTKFFRFEEPVPDGYRTESLAQLFRRRDAIPNSLYVRRERISNIRGETIDFKYTVHDSYKTANAYSPIYFYLRRSKTNTGTHFFKIFGISREHLLTLVRDEPKLRESLCYYGNVYGRTMRVKYYWDYFISEEENRRHLLDLQYAYLESGR